MITITITSDLVPPNVGRSQQFEDEAHLTKWLAERNADLIPGATVNGKKFLMTDPEDAEKTIQIGTVANS